MQNAATAIDVLGSSDEFRARSPSGFRRVRRFGPFRNGPKKTPRIAAPTECPGATRQAGFPFWHPGHHRLYIRFASVGAFLSSFPFRAIPAAEEGDQLCLVRASRAYPLPRRAKRPVARMLF